MSDTSRPVAQWPDAPSSASTALGRGWLRRDSATLYSPRSGAPQGRAGFVLQANGRYTPAADTSGQTAAVLARTGNLVRVLTA